MDGVTTTHTDCGQLHVLLFMLSHRRDETGDLLLFLTAVAWKRDIAA